MKHQAFNPYLPSWEYIPDGEPHVFGDRVYVYGSHDLFDGTDFCLGDYMGWSAPVDDLSDWRCEGVIYPRDGDPLNRDRRMMMFAPDVTQGPDGRYYLYYVLHAVRVVSVAVCDTPAGKYRFYGYVHYPDGTRLGDGGRPFEEPQFDPGVLTEDGKTYLYTGFCGHGDKTRHGCMVTVLDSDMLTMLEAPRIIMPGAEYAAGTPYEGHAYYEAPSIRKRNGLYYLVYSSTIGHELCYGTCETPTGDFRYGGVIVSNGDLGIDTYKPADKPMACTGNNHGGLVEIRGQWYIFYHRQTNDTWFSRQGCAEPVAFEPDGSIPQVAITSRGLNGGPLRGEGFYSAHIACYLTAPGMPLYTGTGTMPRIMQDGPDGTESDPFIGHLLDGTCIGFRDFQMDSLWRVGVITRSCSGGSFDLATAWDGPTLAAVSAGDEADWREHIVPVSIPDGVTPLFLRYHGNGGSLRGIVLYTD